VRIGVTAGSTLVVSKPQGADRNICFAAGIDIAAQYAHGAEDRNASAKRPGLPSNFIFIVVDRSPYGRP
jgi:hypothetical protein